MQTPHVIDEPPVGAMTTHRIRVRNAEGLDRVEIDVRFDASTGPARMLGLFARAAIEVAVFARKERHV